MTWVDNKNFKHQRDIQNERNSMKPKTAKITIRARGYGKSITLNDSQTDLVIEAIKQEIEMLPPLGFMASSETFRKHEELKGILEAIKEGPE